VKKAIATGALIISLVVVGCNDSAATPTPETPAEAVESMVAEEVEAVESQAAEAVEAAESQAAEAVEAAESQAAEAVEAVESPG
jgi:hypothetical protein